MGKLLILDIDEDKYDGFVEALAKRPSIKILPMDRQARKTMKECPCCHKRLSKESAFTVNDLLVDYLITIVEKMAKTKSVIVVHTLEDVANVSSMEHERCVVIDEPMLSRAWALGLVSSFQDGSRASYFVTAAGLAFLSGEGSVKPCTLITLDGEVVEANGEMTFDNIKFKDEIRKGSVKHKAAKAVKALPESVLNFVNNGQMSLI